MKLHHIGYVVHHITSYSYRWNDLTLLNQVTDPLQQAIIALYDYPGEGFIELIQPLQTSSPTWNFLQKNGEGFHHKCYECTSAQMWEYATAQRLIKVMGPVPAMLFEKRIVYFFVNRKGEVIEFLMQ